MPTVHVYLEPTVYQRFSIANHRQRHEKITNKRNKRD